MPAPEPGTSLAYSQFATFALSMPMPMPARSTFVDDQDEIDSTTFKIAVARYVVRDGF